MNLKFIYSMFNFTVPYLSWIAITLLLIGTVVLYLIPIRYLLMLWGMNKFFRRILRPHTVPNNELLDLISRIPDDEMLVSGYLFKKNRFAILVLDGRVLFVSLILIHLLVSFKYLININCIYNIDWIMGTLTFIHYYSLCRYYVGF